MSNLSEIAPTNRLRLMDLVKAAGVDVSDWANCETYASRNPKYCYEWSFVVPKKVVVLNVWYDHMTEKKNGTITASVSMREFAKLREGPERRRGFAMDNAIQTALKDKLPIRVIVLDGRRRNINNPGEKASLVSWRLLDPVSWAVSAYDWKTGRSTLIRGSQRFVDQFSVEQEADRKPNRREVSGKVFIRSPIVRATVLLRAGGTCEWCGNRGFAMADGSIYLETHHVIPLGEGGNDTEENVAALCPNHHRESHHGKNREKMRKGLLERLAKLHC